MVSAEREAGEARKSCAKQSVSPPACRPLGWGHLDPYKPLVIGRQTTPRHHRAVWMRRMALVDRSHWCIPAAARLPMTAHSSQLTDAPAALFAHLQFACLAWSTELWACSGVGMCCLIVYYTCISEQNIMSMSAR